MTSHFSRLLVLMLLLSQTQCVLSQRFNVIATKTPVTSTVGSDVILAFHLSPEVDAENMDIAISRSSERIVFFYRHGQEVAKSQINEYKGRTTFEHGNLKLGKISLMIKDVVPFDNGTYTCFFQSENYYNEAVLEVLVSAIGTDPVIRMIAYKSGITAECESKAWYPMPIIVWKDDQGNDLDPSSIKTVQDSFGLFTVYASISAIPNKAISCNIKSILPSRERHPGIIVSDSVYYRVDRCVNSIFIIASPVILCILLLCIISFLKMLPVLNSRKEMKANIIQKKTDERRAEYNAWEKCLSASKVVMSLDAKTAHPKIDVSEHEKKASFTQPKKNTSGETQKRFEKNLFVLGDKEFTEGVHYLDFKLHYDLCSIGVCSQSLNKNDWINIRESKDICAVHIWEQEHLNFTATQDGPQQLRLYLDCTEKNLTVVNLCKAVPVTRSFKHVERKIFVFFEIREFNHLYLL